MVKLVTFGTVQFGLGFAAHDSWTRLISATSSARIVSMENPLAPLWVWLAFNEEPTFAAWIGCGIVMVAVIGDVAITSQRARTAVQQAGARSARLLEQSYWV